MQDCRWNLEKELQIARLSKLTTKLCDVCSGSFLSVMIASISGGPVSYIIFFFSKVSFLFCFHISLVGCVWRMTKTKMLPSVCGH